MYGMINRAIEDMAVQLGGPLLWEEIRQSAKVTDDFESMRSYPDELTYRLVAAASELLGQTPDELLRHFGRYWIGYAQRSGYGPMLALCGADLPSFLASLNQMHARIAMTLPDLKMPTFDCTEEPDGSLRLQYRSPRPGLAMFVLGLLEGLGEYFGLVLEIEHTVSRASGADHDEFAIYTLPQTIGGWIK